MFQELLINTNNYIKKLLIRSHTVKLFQVLLCITNNSIKLLSFVYTQLNGQSILFLSVRFKVSHFFTYI